MASDDKPYTLAAEQKETDQPETPSRRNLLKGVGVVGAAVVSGNAAAQVIASEAEQHATSPSRAEHQIPAIEALENLTAEEAATLEAICDCLIPSDADGPGAKEARAVHYIDRSLASHNIEARENYAIGLNAINEYARQTRAKAFHELIKDQQNSILLAVQMNKVSGFSPSAASFFNMVRNHTIDGTFCDPYYGGNRDFIGWDMVAYPGIRLGASETDVAMGSALDPTHQSAYDHQTYTKAGNNNFGGKNHA